MTRRPGAARGALTLVLAAFAGGGVLAAGAQAEPAARGGFGDAVRVSVSKDYPPFEYVLEDGRIEGFNVDVMRAVARTMGFQLELRPMLWADALDALRGGEVDALAGMLRSEARESWVDFATPLINIEYSIFVRHGTRGVGSAEDLRGRTVLVERDSLMHEFLVSAGMEAEAVLVDSEPEALRRLDTGGEAAALVPYQQGLLIAQRDGLENVEPSGPPIHSTGWGFAVLDGNQALLERLDRGLADLRRTGEFQEIYNRYLGLGAQHAPESGTPPVWLTAGAAALVLALAAAAAAFAWGRRRPKGGLRAKGDALQLGSYELLEIVGAGGMGEVWRARHLSLSRPAAIKLIRVDALRGGDESAESARVRFEREARATAALRSSRTIELYDYGESEDGSVYYAMELLSGLDLQSLVERFGPLPPERTIHLLRQVCQSLEEAHDAGLLHRDIKPANIFACQLGSEYDAVKVLDFGLVKLRAQEDAGALALTKADVITGTPLCLAPEIVLGAEEIDARSDLYSLGCVAYWLVTGRTVFQADNAAQMAVAHVTEEPEAPSSRLGEPVPEDLEAIVLALLRKKPNERPTSAAELERRLAACRDAGGWTPERAREWWKTCAPEVGKSSSENAGSVLSTSR